jgi:hypothetical protein
VHGERLECVISMDVQVLYVLACDYLHMKGVGVGCLHLS